METNNKDIQDKVMKKVYTVYALKKAQLCALLLAIAVGVLAAVASLISFVDIYRNSRIVVDRGGFLDYIVGAVEHARPITLFLVLLFSTAIAIGVYQFGLTLFRVFEAHHRSKDR